MANVAIRGAIFSAVDDSSLAQPSWQHLEDGVLIVADGRIEQVLPFSAFAESKYASHPLRHYPNSLICPGFVDAHIHYAQTRIPASPAAELIEWLENHTFPEELRFAESDYADEVATEFFDELLRNGTTSALVYPTVHQVSADKLFEHAHQRNVRMVAGKVLMDKNAPDGLLDGEDCGYAETRSLVKKWHQTGRQNYAIVLRFACTSTHEQMSLCGRLVEEYPEMLFHTHLSETREEIDWVLSMYSAASDYLEVYESYGLVTEHSVFAHCIHLSDSECRRMADAGASAVLCPTSNAFLGSGLAQPNRLEDFSIASSLGTDIGGGTSFSMLQTMSAMFGIAKLAGEHLSGAKMFHLATLSGARAMGVDQHVGSFAIGKEADFVILDGGRSAQMRRRLADARDIEELLFIYAMMGNAENVRETWSMGRCVHSRDEKRFHE